MPQIRLGLAATLLLAALARAEPPPDEDALPDGAIARLGSRQRRWRSVLDHAFLDNGRTLLTVHPGPQILERDVASGKLLRVRALNGTDPEAAAISADGRVLAAQRRDRIALWDVNAGRLVREIILPSNSSGEPDPSLFRLTADGVTLVIATAGRLDAWDVRTGHRRSLDPPPASAHSLALALGGRAVIAADRDGVRCWDLASGQVQWTRKGYVEKDKLSVLPGGQFGWVPVRGANVGPGLYDLATGWPIEHQPDSAARGWKCAAPDGRTVCTSDGGAFALRRLDTGAELAGLPEMRQPLGFTPDGRSLLGRDTHYCLQRWDVPAGRAAYAEPEAPAHLDVSLLAFRPDGKSLVSGAEDGGLFRVWDLSTRRPRTLLNLGDSSFLETLTLTPDAGRLLRKGGSSPLELYDLGAGKQILAVETAKPFGYKRLQMRPSPDGRTLYVLMPLWEEGVTFMLQARDLTTGELKSDRAEPTLGGCVAFSPDAAMFASAASGVHDTASGRWRAPLPLSAASVQRMQFAPGAALLAAALTPAACGKGGVTLVETGTGRPVRQLPTGWVGCLEFAPDGRRLVTASAAAIQVWDVFTGRALKRWPVTERIPEPGRMHPAATALAISPDGRTLATGHADGTILLWPMPAIPASGTGAAAERDRLWLDLAADDAGRAWAASARLLDAPADALALLREHLRPTTTPEPRRIRTLLAELTHADFARREAASRYLAAWSDLIEPALRDALASARSPEQKQRLNDLLTRPPTLRDSDRVRRWRAAAVLERLAAPESRSLLSELARGPAGIPETEAASAALRRLNAHP